MNGWFNPGIYDEISGLSSQIIGKCLVFMENGNI
jgi:hypothetical protein